MLRREIQEPIHMGKINLVRFRKIITARPKCRAYG